MNTAKHVALSFSDRCAIAAACLPKADYRTKLEALHAEMLAALAVRVPLTDEQIDAVTRQQWGEQLGVMMMAHRAYARAIEAAAKDKP